MIQDCEGCISLSKRIGCTDCGYTIIQGDFIKDCPCRICLLKVICTVACEKLVTHSEGCIKIKVNQVRIKY